MNKKNKITRKKKIMDEVYDYEKERISENRSLATMALGLQHVPPELLHQLKLKYNREHKRKAKQGGTQICQSFAEQSINLKVSRAKLAQFVREALVEGAKLAAARRYGVQDMALFLSDVALKNELQYSRLLAEVLTQDELNTEQHSTVQYVNNIPLVPLTADNESNTIQIEAVKENEQQPKTIN